MKAYRKRFIQFNMLLVGVVLLLALTLLGAYLYHNARRELRMTMEAVVRPLDAVAALREDKVSPGAAPEPRPLPDHMARGYDSETRRSINTVFYDDETGEITLLAETPLIQQSALPGLVSLVTEKESDYGTLKDLGLVYYRSPGGDRIALASTRYIWDLLKNVYGILLAVFAAVMGLFYLISRRISHLAVKPLEEAMLREKQFVADASHDLKTPLTIVLANNSILRENPEATVAQQSKWIDSTDDAVRRMQRLIDGMLTLSQLDAQENVPPPSEKVDLSSVLTRAALQMESLAYEQQVTLETDIPDGVTVTGSSDYLQRVAEGLIENALKYEPAGGRIDLTLKVEKRRAVFSVRNESSRIPEDDLPHVFERFYRGDRTRSSQGGHGLGLSIVKRMIERMGGRIEVESRESSGTVFRVFLPL
ncbi:MAG: hypothetical protein IK141_00245 [Clostridia bacterium]|nr:hypothetical protein [Clostridia bacterium]